MLCITILYNSLTSYLCLISKYSKLSIIGKKSYKYRIQNVILNTILSYDQRISVKINEFWSFD